MKPVSKCKMFFKSTSTEEFIEDKIQLSFKTFLQSMAPVPQWSRHFSGPTLREGSAGGGGAVGAGPSRPCLYLENCSQLGGNLGWVV